MLPFDVTSTRFLQHQEGIFEKLLADVLTVSLRWIRLWVILKHYLGVSVHIFHPITSSRFLGGRSFFTCDLRFFLLDGRKVFTFVASQGAGSVWELGVSVFFSMATRMATCFGMRVRGRTSTTPMPFFMRWNSANISVCVFTVNSAGLWYLTVKLDIFCAGVTRSFRFFNWVGMKIYRCFCVPHKGWQRILSKKKKILIYKMEDYTVVLRIRDELNWIEGFILFFVTASGWIEKLNIYLLYGYSQLKIIIELYTDERV